MEKENVIVVGNGPSLKEIDYSRLPKDFDVFRTNTFFMEDKYYLGKKAKMIVIWEGIFFETFYTLMKCLFKKEYDFENVFLANPQYTDENKDCFMKYCKNIFPNILYSKDIPKLRLYYYFMHFEKCVRKITPRTGITAIALAASLGYKKIYLVGFDGYYENKINYAFSHSLYNKIGGG